MNFEDMRVGTKVQIVKYIDWFPIGGFAPGMTGKVIEVLHNMKMARVLLHTPHHLLNETEGCLHVGEWPGSQCRAEHFETIEVVKREESLNDVAIDIINEILDGMPEHETRPFRERIRETAVKFRESVKAIISEYHKKRAAEESQTIAVGDFGLVELCEQVADRFHALARHVQMNAGGRFSRSDIDSATMDYDRAKDLITELTGKKI